MEHALNPSAVRRVLPKTCEFLRAISGLVAIVVLAGFVLTTTQLAGTTLALVPPTRDPAAPAPEPVTSQPKAAAIAPQATFPIRIFYLVRSPQQEAIADSNEHIGAMEAYVNGFPMPDREYRILDARDEAEERAAATAILEGIAGFAGAVLVEVIDLRDVLDDDP